MKKRLRKKLEKEDIFIKNFTSEYRQLKKTKEQNKSLLKYNNDLKNHIKEITPNEVVISKAMYFGLVGYLPKDIPSFISNYKLKNRPLKLGGVQILVGSGLRDERGNSEQQTLLEEIYIEDLNLKEKYVLFLFKGFQIRIKVPIVNTHIKTNLRGVDTETTCWSWDFIHAGIRVVSDADFSSLIVFYKTAVELGTLMGTNLSGNYKSIGEKLGDY